MLDNPRRVGSDNREGCGRRGIRLGEQAVEDVLDLNEVMATPLCLMQTPPERFPDLWGHGQVAGSGALSWPDRHVHMAADCSRIGAENLQHSRHVAVTDQPEQQMRCSDVLGVTRIGFVMGLRDNAPRTLAELIKHPPPPLLPLCCRQSSRCNRNWPLTPPLTAVPRPVQRPLDVAIAFGCCTLPESCPRKGSCARPSTAGRVLAGIPVRGDRGGRRCAVVRQVEFARSVRV